MGPLLGREIKTCRGELAHLASITGCTPYDPLFQPNTPADPIIPNHQQSHFGNPFKEMKSLLYYHIVHFHVRAVDSMSK